VITQEKFRDAPPLDADGFDCEVVANGKCIDLLVYDWLSVEEARQLRDWLNKVLP